MKRVISQIQAWLDKWYGPGGLDLKKAIVYDIQNVIDYAQSFGGKEANEITFATPPWPFVYAEALLESFPVVFIAETSEITIDLIKRWRVRLHMIHFVGGSPAMFYRTNIDLAVSDGSLYGAPEWEIYLDCLVNGTKVRSPLFEQWFPAKELAKRDALWAEHYNNELRDRKALILKHRYDSHLTRVQREALDITLKLKEATGQLFGNIDEEISKGLPDRMALLFFLATMLANCKNVESAVIPADEKLIKAQLRRGKQIYKWYTLKIDPMRKAIKAEGGEASYEKAFHICRGHFKTYSSERPLLGRLAGRFWWPMHTRGSREAGEVTKDYALKGKNVKA